MAQGAPSAPTGSSPSLARPVPPEALRRSGALVLPAPDVAAWLRATFLGRGAILHNPDHAHLEHATIGVLWTNVDYTRKQRRIVGLAERLDTMRRAGAWQRARAELQLLQWFGPHGTALDFLLTFSAPYAFEADDASWCALVEHELYHCAQALDPFGAPKFDQLGRPVYDLKGHDVEQFTGVVRRYGADAAGVTALVKAAAARPLMSSGAIAWACGTCARAA